MEYIVDTLWPTLADIDIRNVTDLDKIPNEHCILHANGKLIPEVFNHLNEKYQTDPHPLYVLITSGDDAGPSYQPYHQIKDIIIEYEKFFGIKERRYNAKTCNPSHPYIIRDNFYAYGTFKEIPDNLVQWFATHNNIVSKQIMSIPVGVSQDFINNGKKLLIKDFVTKFDDIKYQHYMNFKDTTSQRKEFKQTQKEYHIGHTDNTIEKILDIISSQYILCPPDVGLDTELTLEALYLGRIPIVENNNMNTMLYGQFPILRFNENNKMLQIGQYYEKTKLDAYFWRKVINNYRLWFEGLNNGTFLRTN